MDHGELLWEALWLTIQHPRGDHEALWAPCWKSSMTSGIEFRAFLAVHEAAPALLLRSLAGFR